MDWLFISTPPVRQIKYRSAGTATCPDASIVSPDPAMSPAMTPAPHEMFGLASRAAPDYSAMTLFRPDGCRTGSAASKLPKANNFLCQDLEIPPICAKNRNSHATDVQNHKNIVRGADLGSEYRTSNFIEPVRSPGRQLDLRICRLSPNCHPAVERH